MHRLLIVDDEPRIADGMYHVLNSRDELNLEIYKAYSGVEALELLRKLRIDILVSDIRMPGMDGIELLDRVSAYWPGCRVIFLTGHSEFTYVYEAIRKPNVKYILKTEGIVVIVQAVKDTIRSLETEQGRDRIIAKAEEQLGLAMPVLRKELILSILGGESLPAHSRSKRFSELGISLDPEKKTLLLVGRIDYSGADRSYTEKLKSYYAVQEAFDCWMNESVAAMPVMYDSSHIVWLLQCPDEYIHVVKGNLEVVQEHCNKLVGAAVSFAISRDSVDWDDLFVEFEALLNKLRKYAWHDQMMIVAGGSANATQGDMGADEAATAAQFKRGLKQLEACFDKGNVPEFPDIFERLMDLMGTLPCTGHFVSIQLQFSVSVLYMSFLNRLGLVNELAEQFDSSGLVRPDSFRTWEQFALYYRKLGTWMMNKQRQNGEVSINGILERIHTYMNGNLDKELSLTRLAEIVYLNPSYLSRFFKQHTGKNLIKYILERRVQKAKELLEDKTLKINEIAARTGFDSSSYFTACFKKMEGVSPQEYRDSL